MTPYSEDEAMLRDINHVGHRDGGREAVAAFFLVCGPLAVLAIQYGFRGALLYLALMAIMVVGGILSWLVHRWVGGMDARARAAMAADQRESAAREQERQIAEMKAREANAASGMSG